MDYFIISILVSLFCIALFVIIIIRFANSEPPAMIRTMTKSMT